MVCHAIRLRRRGESYRGVGFLDRPMSSVAKIDALIERRHLLKHPFYQAWTKGEVPLETLRRYAGEYYHFESNFPRYVAGVYAKETDPDRRRVLLDNLVDEEGRATTHPQLWRQFARALGAPDPAVETHRQSAATRALCETYDRLAVQGGLHEGLGALYAYESIFPAVAHEKARGLKEHYGIRSKSALEFFTVHETADQAHSAAERQLLEAEMHNAATRRAAEQGARASIDAWWNFLDQFVP